MRLSAIGIFCLLATAVSAAEVGGTLFDSTGAVIGGARVMLMDQNYVKLAETKSGEQGEFTFKDLKPALYLVQAKKPRFNLAQQHVFLTEEKPGRVHLMATPGRGEDTFTITAGFPDGTPPEPAARRTFRTGGNIDDYKLVQRAMPAYPESARKRGAHGTVVLFGRIKTDGSVGDIMTLESPDTELEKVSVDAFRQWRFQPVKLNGVAIEVAETAIFDFQQGK